MSNTALSAIQKKIAALQAKADQIHELEKAKQRKKLDKEKPGVISRIRKAINAYGITTEELYSAVEKSVSKKSKSPAKASGKAKATAVFGDANGNTWSGRGPCPKWLKAAMEESGKTLVDFTLSAHKAATGAAPQAAPSMDPGASKPLMDSKATSAKKSSAPKAATKVEAPIKYKDESGNVWKGRGSMPAWLKTEISSGKQLQDFLIKN